MALAFLSLTASPAETPPQEANYYLIESVPLPDGVVMESSGLDFGPDGRLYVSTRRGEIWSLGNWRGQPDQADWKLFARYLHEPLSLAWHEDWLYAVQRPEVTRLRDEDGDGRADVFECVSDGWGISGDYHEYAFMTRPDREGNFWVVLCLTGSFTAEALYRGWVLRVNPGGQTIPTAYGVRSPGGIGFGPGGEVYYCDNQGAWNGSSSLKHLKPGSFQGNPNGNVFFPSAKGTLGQPPPFPKLDSSESRIELARQQIPSFVPPAVVFPHGKLGQSPTGIELISHDRFGPFQGQLLVAEQTFSQVQRVFLEEIKGVRQGAAFPFLSGFPSGNIALRLSEDGFLFTGGSNRGWGARGGQAHSFDRVTWTGATPFEVHEMRIRKDGFELTFTQPVDPGTLVAESFRLSAYTYLYRPAYGSPEVDPLTPQITALTPAPDGKSVHIKVSPLTKGHVHELHFPGLRSAEGLPLLHPVAYYTVNEIPD